MSVASQQRLQATARRLIAADGRSITLRKDVTTPSDPTRPWKEETTQTFSTHNTVGVFTNFDTRDLEARVDQFSRLVLTPIQTGSSLLWVPADDVPFDVTTDTQVIDGDRVWEIIQVRLEQPGNLPIVYALEVST